MRVCRRFEPLSIRQPPQSSIPLHGARQPEVTGPDVGVNNAHGKDLAFIGTARKLRTNVGLRPARGEQCAVCDLGQELVQILVKDGYQLPSAN